MLQKWIAGAALMVASTTGVHADYCGAPPADILQSVVRISGENTEGSGVIVAPDRVITAAHVIASIKTPMVDINGVQRPANVMFVNRSKDFALLEVSTGGQNSVPLRSVPLQDDAAVWAVGFPLGGPQVINEGTFEGVIEDGTLHTTASVDHGQSGGGLISCENGHHVLAGMTTGFGAISVDGEIIRLDDYSVSLSAMDIQPLLQVNSHQAVAWVDTHEITPVTEPYFEEYIPAPAPAAAHDEEDFDPAVLSRLGSAEYYPYLYYEVHP